MRQLFKDLYSGQRQNKAAAYSTCVNKAALVKRSALAELFLRYVALARANKTVWLFPSPF